LMPIKTLCQFLLGHAYLRTGRNEQST
jgi:hypothetical protein